MANGYEITDDNVEQAEKYIDKYARQFQDIKSGTENITKNNMDFLKPIAEGFRPEVTSKATSIFGMKTNPAVLAAIGGLASGLSGGKTDDKTELTRLQNEAKEIEKREAKKIQSAKSTTDIIKIVQGWSEDLSKSQEAKRINQQLLNYNTLDALPEGQELTGAAVTAAIKSFAKILLPEEAVMTGDEDAIVRAMMQKPPEVGDKNTLERLAKLPDWRIFKEMIQKNITGNTIPASGLKDMKSLAENAIFNPKNLASFNQKRDSYVKLIDMLNRVNELGENAVNPDDILYSPFNSYKEKMDEVSARGGKVTLSGIKPAKEIPAKEIPKRSIKAEQQEAIDNARKVLANPTMFSEKTINDARKTLKDLGVAE